MSDFVALLSNTRTHERRDKQYNITNTAKSIISTTLRTTKIDENKSMHNILHGQKQQ